MVIYLSVKFEFDWTQHFRVRVLKQKCWRTKNRQTNRQNYTNFERTLAVMVIYLPVKFEFDWTKLFRVRIRKQKYWRTDKWTKNRQRNGQNYTNFELSYDGDLSPCQVWIRLDKQFFESGNRNFDRQTEKKRTNKRTELHQFWKEPSYDGDLSPCQVWIQLDKPFSS